MMKPRVGVDGSKIREKWECKKSDGSFYQTVQRLRNAIVVKRRKNALTRKVPPGCAPAQLRKI